MSEFKTQNHNSKFKTNLQSRTYKFSLDIINLVANFLNKKVYWVIGDQVLRSATSIGANIVEAKASSSKREFIRYYEIALKSCNETKYWLSLLIDGKLGNIEILNKLKIECVELGNMLGASLLTVKGKKVY